MTLACLVSFATSPASIPIDCVESMEKVDALTAELKADGYEVISGPRTTGDGYYESCIVAVEDNQIEITV